MKVCALRKTPFVSRKLRGLGYFERTIRAPNQTSDRKAHPSLLLCTITILSLAGCSAEVATLICGLAAAGHTRLPPALLPHTHDRSLPSEY
jgi:hypothetical protein